MQLQLEEVSSKLDAANAAHQQLLAAHSDMSEHYYKLRSQCKEVITTACEASDWW